MITISNLTISYGNSSTPIRSLNLNLESGAIHGIVGLNGSGKTTLLSTIYGTISQRSGSIHYNGEGKLKRFISFLPTENYFYPSITGKEYLTLFKGNGFDINGWNSLFNLPLNTLIETYSTGMKKQLALLAILKLDKPIMILDEPFNGIDIETSTVVRQALIELGI
jgi:ABC-2 type transport system ATP-binding protein